MSTRSPKFHAALLTFLAGTLAGCTLTPKGADQQREAIAEAGKRYAMPFAERNLPELPEKPIWTDILARGLVANGELEAAYYEWKAAMDQVTIAGAWPNSDVSLGFSYTFSGGQMKSIDRATFTAGFDPSMNVSVPSKIRQQAKVALDQARVAGARLRVVKFELQKRLLFAWNDYILGEQQIDLMRKELALLKLSALAAAAQAPAAGPGVQPELIGARAQALKAQSSLDDMVAEHDSQRASINAMLLRDPNAPLVSGGFGPPRYVPEDAALLAAAVDEFPEVHVASAELATRKDALEVAKQRWIPDFDVSFSVTGTVSQAVGAAIMLPTRSTQIRAQIQQSQTEIQAAEAVLRQRRADRIGEYVALIVMLRRSQQRQTLYESQIVPAADQIAASRDRQYREGQGMMQGLLEARRESLQAQRVGIQSAAQIQKLLVDIECCLGVDVETIQPTPPQQPIPAATSIGAAAQPAIAANLEAR